MSFLSGLPDDIVDTVTKIIENIQNVEDSFKDSEDNNYLQLSQKSKLETLQYELTHLYAINALFFVYLQCNGIDAKTHPIKEEMERISSKLKYCSEYKDKDTNKSQIDKEACGRMIRHNLWESLQGNKRKLEESLNESTNGNQSKKKRKKNSKKSVKNN